MEDKGIAVDSGSDSNSSGADKEEESDNDSATGEYSVTVEVKGELVAFREEQLQESKELDEAVASENAACSGSADKEILSVELPAATEKKKSPFDFIIDPYGLLYETNAMRYGGGAVEEGATLLFCNEEGKYDFFKIQ